MSTPTTPTTWFEFCEMILMDPERATKVLSDPRSIAEMTALVKIVGEDVGRARTNAQQAKEIQQVKEHMDAVLAAEYYQIVDTDSFFKDYADKAWLRKNKVAKQLYDELVLYQKLLEATLPQDESLINIFTCLSALFKKIDQNQQSLQLLWTPTKIVKLSKHRDATFQLYETLTSKSVKFVSEADIEAYIPEELKSDPFFKTLIDLPLFYVQLSHLSAFPIHS